MKGNKGINKITKWKKQREIKEKNEKWVKNDARCNRR
jgi:hypothetical protein